MVEASILATALLVGRSKLPNILSFGSVHDGRLLAVFVSLIVLMPYMITTLTEFMQRIAQRIVAGG